MKILTIAALVASTQAQLFALINLQSAAKGSHGVIPNWEINCQKRIRNQICGPDYNIVSHNNNA